MLEEQDAQKAKDQKKDNKKGGAIDIMDDFDDEYDDDPWDMTDKKKKEEANKKAIADKKE